MDAAQLRMLICACCVTFDEMTLGLLKVGWETRCGQTGTVYTFSELFSSDEKKIHRYREEVLAWDN